ncbi:MAG: DNA repair protein RadC [Methylicorpusculum sp.]|uniref:RadC family protein n=1 Tax=Methylicorpusculum sp. TaxID=2713644 RepID=UPI00271EE26B|nr:DNA repair protein RadC [Methylicorpusculum sp.]MDO8941063.1 DNA repair protein RadC [Methylicorpusculum sp.]MDP2202338.1 DNA repair protein RadC [Methylicorpusculum sp.]
MLYIQDSTGNFYPAAKNQIIAEAISIYDNHFAQGVALTTPDQSRAYFKIKLGNLEHEVFSCLFLTNQHQIIVYEEMFRGTIDSASVYPREVVKTALERNAAAVILAHNHPSGISEPSCADQAITEKLKAALALIDVRVLDHLIIGRTIYSFAEHGRL